MIFNANTKKGARKRKVELREKLWPGVSEKHLWDRHNRDGYATVPRGMPLLIAIMNDLAEKGQPVGAVYLELWCRLNDEGYLNLNQPQDMAFAAGFTGQRALYTWRDRLAKLQELGFIDFKEGSGGKFSYALFWNPYHVVRKHHEAGRVSEAKWRALVFRASEIGATDLDEDLPDDSTEVAPKSKRAKKT